jgi:hypothetical protein
MTTSYLNTRLTQAEIDALSPDGAGYSVYNTTANQVQTSDSSGNWAIGLPGAAPGIQENINVGRATLVNGVATIMTTAIKSSSHVHLTYVEASATAALLQVPISTRVEGVSFTIQSTNFSDNSTVTWKIENSI